MMPVKISDDGEFDDDCMGVGEADEGVELEAVKRFVDDIGVGLLLIFWESVNVVAAVEDSGVAGVVNAAGVLVTSVTLLGSSLIM